MEDWLSAYRRLALGAVVFAAFMGGLCAGHSVAARVLAALTFASATTLWCSLDARMHGKSFLHSFGWQLMWTWPVGMAVYLVWTRRWRGLLTYLLLGAACLGAAGVGAGIAFASAE